MNENSHRNVCVFDDAEEVSQAAQRFVASLLPPRRSIDRPVHLALAGGSTPKALYELLARDQSIDWSRVHIWFGDERPVPPGHVDCNYSMVEETLIQHIDIRKNQVHRMRGELDPTVAAAEYEAEVERHVLEQVEGWPSFDLILLGLGEDGHTASLFPETPALIESTRSVVENPVPQFDTIRITLTQPVLNAAQNVLFLATGEAKAPALADTLRGGCDAPPASLVRPSHGNLYWYVDRAAASLLP